MVTVRRSRMILESTSTLFIRRMLRCVGRVQEALRGATAGSVDRKGSAGPESSLATASSSLRAAIGAGSVSYARPDEEASSPLSPLVADAVFSTTVAASRRMRD